MKGEDRMHFDLVPLVSQRCVKLQTYPKPKPNADPNPDTNPNPNP